MNELDAILDTWRRLNGPDRDAVLATVVHVTGSAYRRPGARMLVPRAGERVGSVSGGCLEGEIVRKAWWFTQGGAPVIRAYDTTSEDGDPAWEFGLGCNGVVHVMLERTTMAGTAETLEFLRGRREAGEAAVVATVIRTDAGSGVRVGDRLLVDDTWVHGALVGSAIEEAVHTRAAEVLRSAESRLVHLREADVFIEWIGPPLSLVVFGAGDDAAPLVAMAKVLGWRVTVADGRPAYARAGRFPGADRVVVLTYPSLLRDIDMDAGTAVVMMTHNYPLDARVLPLILDRRPRYLGLLGPRSRTEQLFAGLGLDVPVDVHAPAGLDIGGDTPAAAAMSITAEIQAATHQRAGGMLRLRNDAIHPPVVEVGAPALLQAEESGRPAYCETHIGSNV